MGCSACGAKYTHYLTSKTGITKRIYFCDECWIKYGPPPSLREKLNEVARLLELRIWGDRQLVRIVFPPVTLHSKTTGEAYVFESCYVMINIVDHTYTLYAEPDSDGIRHPHANCSGVVCVGDYYDCLLDYFDAGNYVGFLTTCLACLNTYTPHGAYYRFNEDPCEFCGDSYTNRQCVSCGKWMCVDCEGMDGNCVDCSEQCSYCGELCVDLVSCEYCGDWVCDSCHETCINCEKCFCTIHISECKECGDWICTNCSIRGLCQKCLETQEEEKKKREAEKDQLCLPFVELILENSG